MPTNQNTCTYIYQLQCVAIDVLAGLGSLDQRANKDNNDKNGLKIISFLWQKAVLHPGITSLPANDITLGPVFHLRPATSDAFKGCKTQP